MLEPVQPPVSLSEGARDYLLSPPVVAYPSDWSNSEQVQAFRDQIHPIWEQDAVVDFDFALSEKVIAGIRTESVSTEVNAQRLIVHVHGGMYCVGTTKMDRMFTAPLARAAGAEVLSIDYRLAPEDPYPAGLDDVVSVCRSLLSEGRDIALVGESAGGGLALAAAQVMARETPEQLARLALVSPMLDLSASSDTYRTLAPVDPDYSDTTALTDPGRAYAGGIEPSDPRVSPLFGEMAGLPATLVQVGNREVLFGDSVRMARAARDAGVVVDLVVLDGGMHNYPIYWGWPEAAVAVQRLATHLTA